jgi:hypothetical protein
MRFRKLRITWTVFCGIACVLLIVLWVRSYWRGDLIGVVGNRSLHIRSEQGLIFTDVSTADAGDRRGWRHRMWPQTPDWSPWSGLGRHWWDRLGFGHYVGSTSTNQRVDQFVVPHYFVVVIAGLLAALPVASKYSSRRRFSLRTMLIATTLVAVVLGLIVYSIKK